MQTSKLDRFVAKFLLFTYSPCCWFFFLFSYFFFGFLCFIIFLFCWSMRLYTILLLILYILTTFLSSLLCAFVQMQFTISFPRTIVFWGDEVILQYSLTSCVISFPCVFVVILVEWINDCCRLCVAYICNEVISTQVHISLRHFPHLWWLHCYVQFGVYQIFCFF